MTTMDDYAAEAVLAHYGHDRVRPPADLRGLVASDTALLHRSGLPDSAGPYFTALADGRGQPRQLGAYATALGIGLPAGLSDWYRLGHDRGRDLCVAGDGAVRAVYAQDPALPPLFVNSNLGSFLATLARLDQAVGAMGSAGPGSQEAGSTYSWLHETVDRVDHTALADPESWWPRVLQDLRHTAQHPAFASAEIDGPGGTRIVTASGLVAAHPEERLWHTLSSQGVPGTAVTRLYTELAACDLPGHHCSLWMADAFPNAAFTHSFTYGPTLADRETGMRELLRAAAEAEHAG